MAFHGHSEACCTIPPAQHDYKGKGDWIEVDGLKTYKVGPSTAKTALLFIFDIFGHSSQAFQGADFLAHSDDEHHQYQVYVPDFFNGPAANVSDYPPDNEEKKKRLGDFFSGPANPQDAAKKVPHLLESIQKQSPGIEKWGVVGFCWGGKIVSLTTQKGTPFTVAAVAHPAFIDPEEAKGITVPFLLLASEDEDKEQVKKFEKELKVEHQVDHETFGHQIHGFMAARANLKEEKNRKDYEKGYKMVLDFIHKYL